ncbi:hypothetical protein [Helicobacter sp. MIT 99-5507]|uniref:hypothetical protein n=1 Tax=Helicobacter sp. MIT 99-5507 TaxID=152489 RepID=UPI000E1E4904|nr:hypothetical protein [Helicobacter sp. MIT 99-5507]RDU57371.1 hypothetical protein CQA42_05385 [Helicobacter sp. MIT 99-5507]
MSAIEAMKDAMQGNSKKTIFAFGVVIIVIAILVAVTYFFYYTDSNNYDNNIDAVIPEVVQESQQETQNNTQANQVESTAPIAETNQINNENAANNQANSSNEPSLKTIAQNIETPPAISQLKYAIKPLDKNIASCNTMKNGKWDMPSACKDDVLNAIKVLINTNSEIIALEVSGIVDNSPYSGPSAELKQEGLASFRAREAIGVITRGFSNVAVFEGLSIQAPNKRGFEVKAYYLQN